MAKKNKNPEVRFKGFSEDWEIKKLKDVATYSNGGSFENDVKESGRYELITLKSIDMSGKLVHSGRFIDIETPTLDESTLVMILSEQSPGLLGMTAQIPISNRYVLNQRVAEIRPHQNIDSYFLSMVINKNQPYFSSRGAGTKVQNISKPNVENYEFLCPLITEQKQIGSFFQNLDNLITLHQKKYDKLVILKKAMLEKLFPRNGAVVPEIRFKGFTEVWEVKRLGDFAQIKRGLTYSPIDVSDKGVKVLRSSNIYEDTFVQKEDDVYVNAEAINIEFAKENDILITSANGSSRLVGKHALLENLKGKVVHGGFMLIARSKNPYFLNASMSSPWYRKFININVAGGNGAIGNLKSSDFEEQGVFVPNEDEQQKIGDYFKNLDNQIVLHQTQLKKLNNIKKACFTKMFVAQD